tara:strand:- start:813 stop:1436 length:624 start_codon:yes stop_codon:yes gene_type:complete
MAAGDRYVEITREELESWLKRNFGRDWNRDERTAGVYLIHLSESVAVKMVSSIGRKDRGMGLGKASMKLMLSSRITGRPLNKKAKDRAHFQRTKNWKKSWLAGIRHWEGVYNKYPDFYDRIGLGEEVEEKKEQAHKPDPEMLRKLRELWIAARGRQDEWTQDFAASVGKQIKVRPLSEKQQNLAEKKFKQYRIAKRVAARYAAHLYS